MNTFRFEGLYNGQRWLMPAYVTVDGIGKIVEIMEEEPQQEKIERVLGYAIPGFQNAHSHAFQYAMAGICEQHQLAQDDFWSWRNMMYHLALNISPEHLEGIATALYVEMLRHGYTAVAEFHYLHHDKKGQSYTNLAEMGDRLCSAAQKAGIKITLLPVFYQKGGFGQEANQEQRRFLSKDYGVYLKLLEASKQVTAKYKNASLGMAIHSLRAVEPVIIKEVFNNHKDEVIHLHIAEQLQEVEDALKFYQKRPVQWLVDNVNLNEKHHLVHATHLLPEEIKVLAKTKVNVVLCPSTEGNLGDGLFPLLQYQGLNGQWSIGTDSHVGLNPLEELRLLDYGQRLSSHQRNVFVNQNELDSGSFALKQVCFSGKKAMGDYESRTLFGLGQDFDACVISSDQMLIANTSKENLLSTILYSADVSMFLGTIVAGQWKIKNQHHSQQSSVFTAFSKVIQEVKNR